MNFCYCVGGTGARVAEVAAYLCAMNMITGDDKDITFFVVDKDKSCGGTKHAISVLQAITNLADVNNGGKNALKRSDVFQNKKYYFCNSKLNFSAEWDFTNAIDTLINEGAGRKIATNLKKMITEDRNSNADDQVLLNAFFSKEEQEQTNEGGFYGHPSAGAFTFKYMSKKGHWATEEAKSDIAQPVVDFLNNNNSGIANVFIIGSVFGGTGASVFPNLASQIRSSVKAAITDFSKRLVISGVLLLPYFAAHKEEVDNPVIDSTDFYQKTKIALEQYGKDKNMMRTGNNQNGYFDSLYVCGQDPLNYTGNYADHGAEQQNHFDLVDLVAARAMVEFFNNPSKAQEHPGRVLLYRFTDADTPISSVDLAGIIEMKRNLSTMLYFSTFVITKVYGMYLANGEDPENVPIFDATYNVSKELKSGFLRKQTNNEYAHIKDEAENFLKNIYSFCKNFILMMRDISYNGKDWSTKINALSTDDHSENYNFYNRSYIENLIDICDTIDENTVKANKIGAFCARRDYLGGEGENSGIEFDDMIISLKEKFKDIIAQYQVGTTSMQLRFSDYLHEAYDYCYRYFK